MNDQYIIDYFWENKKFLIKKKLENIPTNILLYLNNRYNDSLSLLETINRIKYNISKHPLCPICKKKLVKYCGRILSKNIFQSTCDDIECKNKYKGYKSQKTKLERYNDKNYNNSKKMMQTKLEKYGNSGYHNIDKMKKTNLEKYGVNNIFQSNIFKEKSKKTKLERYNNENYNNLEKTKKTKLERYNNENYTNREQAVKNTNYNKQQENIKKTCLEKYGLTNGGGNKESLNKIKNTCLNKYNKEFYFQTDEFKIKSKNTLLNKYGVEFPLQSEYIKSKINYKEIIEKTFKTKKKNNSFNKSNPEDTIYNYLIKKFKIVKRQYICDKYPFHCDFYIPEIDLYIEYQGFWTHNNHPYNKYNINDQNILNKWKLKQTKFYKNAINIWTKQDVLKRKIAKENNLNFIEFFYIKDFYNWYKNYN